MNNHILHNILRLLSIFGAVLGIIVAIDYYSSRNTEAGTLLYFYWLFCSVVGLIWLLILIVGYIFDRSERKSLVRTGVILLISYLIVFICVFMDIFL